MWEGSAAAAGLAAQARRRHKASDGTVDLAIKRPT